MGRATWQVARFLFVESSIDIPCQTILQLLRMARVKLSPELKEAVSDLSHKEKDRLLFRLLPKDAALVEQLIFKLLEDGETTELRRESLWVDIEGYLHNAIESYYRPGYLLLDLRSCSGLINAHVRTTRDKYGEVQVSLRALLMVFDALENHLQEASSMRMRTFAPYVVKRSFKLLRLVSKLHEDLQFDFRDDFRRLAGFLEANPHFRAQAGFLGENLQALAEMEDE